MATNLLIGHNVERRGSGATATNTATGYDGANLTSGSSLDRWKAGSAGTSFDLEATGTAGTTNYLALHRADLCILDDAACELDLYTGLDVDTYGDIVSDSGVLTSANLVGPHARDYLVYTATPWGEATDTAVKLVITYGASGTPELSKFYAGTAFDMGRDPIELAYRRTRNTYSAEHALYEISISWVDVTYAKAMLFKNNILEVSSYHPIVLFTAANHAVLPNSCRCIWCEIIDAAMPQRVTSKNDITLQLRELV